MEVGHVRTVELLAAKAANWGLPAEDVEEQNEEEAETLLAEALSKSLEHVRIIEVELVEAQYPPEVSVLRLNMQRMRTLRERTDTCNERMKELLMAYQSVSGRTSSLHDACDRALAEQTALSTGSQLIKTNLYYFKQADSIMKKLSAAKLMVTGQSFAALLASIDECLSFLRQHPEYRESAAYTAKFEQCLSKAITWVRVSVLADVETCFNYVKDRQLQLEVDYEKIGRGGADEDTFSLLYGVFATRASSVKNTLLVLEERFWNVAEYEEMLAECQYAYFAKRNLLLAPILQSTLAALSTVHAESTCRLTRDACTFMLRTCDDEYRLYRQFFVVKSASSAREDGRSSPGSTAPSMMTSNAKAMDIHPFEGFNESMCRLLYDMLRPRIIHNPHLETLAELCTMIKVDMIENRCSVQVVSTLMGDVEAAFNPRAGFVAVMSELVGDIAERIVHRAELYSQNDIATYRPSAGDIAYPQMLEMMRQIEQEQKAKARASQSISVDRANELAAGPEDLSPTSQETNPVAALDQHCLWYPTVRRTVMCLSKLFNCLDVAVFNSLCRDMLISCCASLETAAQAIAAQKSPSKAARTKLDCDLFVVKHLLILREQTAPYRQISRSETNLPTKEFSLDFTKLTNIIFDQKSRWFELSANNSLLELVTTVPIEMKENENDIRRMIDAKLRVACFRLASTTSELLIGPLSAFADVAEDESLKPGFELAKHPELSADRLKTVAGDAYKAIGIRFAEICDAYSLYIGVVETEKVLLSPVRKRVLDVFSRVAGFAGRVYDEDSRAVAALPSIQQLLVLLNKQTPS